MKSFVPFKAKVSIRERLLSLCASVDATCIVPFAIPNIKQGC